MLKSEMNKLYRKLITLAILLGCLGLLVSSSRTTQVRAECGDDLCIQQFNHCREFYCNGQDCQPCIDQFMGCKLGCPMPEGTPDN